MCLSRHFSSSGSLSRRASSAFIPPFRFCQRSSVAGVTSRDCSISASYSPAFSIAFASGSFGTICFGDCRRRRFLRSHGLLSVSGCGNLHHSGSGFLNADHVLPCLIARRRSHDIAAGISLIRVDLTGKYGQWPFQRRCTNCEADRNSSFSRVGDGNCMVWQWTQTDADSAMS